MGRVIRYPDTWATPIWPTDSWPTDIWSTDTWPTGIWPISAWGDIWPTDTMSHFNNSFIQFNNRISSIQRAVSDGNITKMWKESKEKFGQNCLLAKCPPMHLLAKCSLAKCPLTKCSLAKCPLTKCPLAKCPLTKCPLAKCPLAKWALVKCPGFE